MAGELANKVDGDAFAAAKPSNRTPAFDLFLRVFGFAVMVGGIIFWSRIVGLNGPDFLILVEAERQTAIMYVGLAVILPPMGVGLWLGMRWGLILWAMVAAALLATHFFLIPLSVELYSVGAIFAILLALYASIRLSFLWLAHRAKKAKLQRAQEDLKKK